MMSNRIQSLDLVVCDNNRGPSKHKILEDPDASSRLKQCLNVYCLAEIFMYLNSNDLWTLGSMNTQYKQIIN